MSLHGSLLRALGLGLLIFSFPLAGTPPLAAAGESGWVRGEIRLNLRTGPGTQYKIVGVARTGDGVDIAERRDDWIRVLIHDGADNRKEGWIPKGYLESEPPASLRLADAVQRADALEADLSELREEADALRQGRDGDTAALKERISELSGQNSLLRSGGRYPEWITGACILGAGMVIGAILHRLSERRNHTRLKI